MELRKYFIYRFEYNDEKPLCIYLCDTQTKDRILVVPLTDKPDGNTYKLSVTRQYADLSRFTELYKAKAISPLYLDSKPVRVPDKDLQAIQQYIINELMQNINLAAKHGNTSNLIFESIYQFLMWKWQKLLLNISPYQKKTTIYENGLYWASLGINVGTELNKNRPVLVWKKRCGGDNESNFSYIVIPITSKEKNKKYYMNIPIDINGRHCYLRIEDLRRINIRRFSRPILNNDNKIIFIDENKRKEINKAIEKFFIFENAHKKT